MIALVALMLARPSIAPEHIGRTAILATMLILAIAAAIASAALNWFRDRTTGGIVLAGATLALFAGLAVAAFQLAPSGDVASVLGGAAVPRRRGARVRHDPSHELPPRKQNTHRSRASDGPLARR